MALSEKQKHDLKKFVKDMVSVHLSPYEDSPVMAYVKPGVTVEVLKEEGGWVTVRLMNRCRGYVELQNLSPVPPKFPEEQ